MLKSRLINNIFFLLLYPLANVNAQQITDQTIDYSVHANIIYHFTKYIDWPENKKAGDFVIGIIGDSPLYEELNNVTSNKTTGNQKIIIKRFNRSQTSFDCHILIITEDESGALKKILSLTGDLPILIITEGDGLASKGSCVNFVIAEEHLKLEFNKNNIEKRSLRIASELLTLGKTVDDNTKTTKPK